MSEQTERLKQDLATLTERVRWLEQQMDQTAERQAQFGRPRYLIWGTLEEVLVAGGSADVQLKAKDPTEPSGWKDWLIMEDVLAPPVMPDDTCIPATTGDDNHATWVCVAWFPLDEEYFVIGAEICPTTDCPDTSSSS